MFPAALRSAVAVLLAVALAVAGGGHAPPASAGGLPVELCSGSIPAEGDSGGRFDPCPDCLRVAAALLPAGAGPTGGKTRPRPARVAGDAAWAGRDATVAVKRVRGPPHG